MNIIDQAKTMTDSEYKNLSFNDKFDIHGIKSIRKSEKYNDVDLEHKGIVIPRPGNPDAFCRIRILENFQIDIDINPYKFVGKLGMNSLFD
ncbi:MULTISPECIES: hypothetical protein [unclassified Chryseobacterium]|uniref:hypothetical protein n=1 Tax=unclassified Chryseobacterium TaxID=2593645 RepID=UPI00285363E8|nr:hypothetical protein [Chryseobacterium sp. CFS7]MDR4892258.1 hypothetical protein [Chryseobacterium sp. CFS7]